MLSYNTIKVKEGEHIMAILIILEDQDGEQRFPIPDKKRYSSKAKEMFDKRKTLLLERHEEYILIICHAIVYIRRETGVYIYYKGPYITPEEFKALGKNILEQAGYKLIKTEDNRTFENNTVFENIEACDFSQKISI